MYQARSHESAYRAGQIADSPYLAAIYTTIGTPPSLSDFSKLTSEEVTRLTYSELQLMRALDNTVQQFELGLLPEEFMHEVRGTIHTRHKLWAHLGISEGKRATFQRYIDDARDPD